MKMRSPGLYRWLEECQLDPDHDYYPGWSESRDFLMELAEHYDSFDFGVLATFMLTTPPPSSEIPMPIVTARSKMLSVTIVENWLVEPYFTVSLERATSRPLSLCGFVERIEPDEPWLLRPLPQASSFGPFSEDSLKFTGAVENQHMLFGLFQLLRWHEQQHLHK
jgi:hypothetical protein